MLIIPVFDYSYFTESLPVVLLEEKRGIIASVDVTGIVGSTGLCELRPPYLPTSSAESHMCIKESVYNGQQYRCM